MTSQKKILIIDDEFPIRYMVETHLRRRDFEVHSAKDGPSGIEAAQRFQPDVIVLDIMMPGMDGFQVCEEIRGIPELADTPVIFLTAFSTRKHKLRAFKVGGNDYLVKPFQAKELLEHIGAVLNTSVPEAYENGDSGPRGRVISVFSPKGGVGTTTIAIQLSEAIVIRKEQPVVLIDLDLPLGGIGPMLNLSSKRHVVDLLGYPPGQISESLIKRFAQRHRSDLLVIPAPGEYAGFGEVPAPTSLQPALDTINAAGHLVIMDVGSNLSTLTLEALRLSDVVYVVTSGRPIANKLLNSFVDSAAELGLEPRRLLPVVNELHGSADNVELNRVPVARIPHARDKSRSKLWLRDQGMQKLVSVTM